MSRRLEFVEDAARGLYSTTELCARYEISRCVGYKWLARFEAEGAAGLVDRPRVAKVLLQRMPEEIAVALLACRRAPPTWGPRKQAARPVTFTCYPMLPVHCVTHAAGPYPPAS